MAFTSVETKVETNWSGTQVVQTLSGGAGTGNLIFSEGLPFGSAQVVLTSGTSPTSVGLLGGNDGIAANMVAIGSVATTFPSLASLSSSLSAAPCKYYSFVVVDGDSTTVLTITIIFMGTRG